MFNNLYVVSSCVWEQMDTGRHIYSLSSLFQTSLTRIASISSQWTELKMFISRKAGQFSHNLLHVFMYKKDKISHQIPKFPTKHQHFLGRSFPISTFFPTMRNGKLNIPGKQTSTFSWCLHHHFTNHPPHQVCIEDGTTGLI